MWAGVGMRQLTELSLSSPHSLFPTSPLVSLTWLPELHHVIRKSGSPPFPLLTERKYCNRGGRHWALLRRWLKITGIFKAAEESQGRQRLDSLPPGRSSLSLSVSFSHGFSLSASSSKPISLYTRPPTHTSTTFSYACGSPPLNYMMWWILRVSWLHPSPALALSSQMLGPGLSKQTAPTDSDLIHMHNITQQNCQPTPSVSIVALWKTKTELFCHKNGHLTFLSLWWFMCFCLLVNIWTTVTGVENCVDLVLFWAEHQAWIHQMVFMSH